MQTKAVSLLLPAMAAVSGFAPAATATAATITVTSTFDAIQNDNACTLREAIIAANTNTASSDTSNKCIAGEVALDTIQFQIPDSDGGCTGSTPKVCTIALNTPLPDITAPVTIDGYTQTNASANTLAIGDDATILIRIDASNISGTIMHLTGGSSGSTIMGLSIVKPGGDANNVGYMMAINGGSNGNTIAGNFIGVEPDGVTVSTKNLIFAGLEIANSSDNTIGGPAPAARNLIAATVAGTAVAINLESISPSNTIQGNYVDLDASGSHGIGNAVIGINVAAGGNTVGGSGAGEGNFIGTWGTVGLQFAFGSGGAVSAKGNFIGTDASGTVVLATGLYGLFIGGNTGTVTIGGSANGEGNLIHGAANGIYINGTATGGTPVIQGNHIGISLDGAHPLPSAASGIIIGSDNSGGTIGGEGPGEGNVIAFSGANAITNAFAKDWSFLGNSIYNNGFGISLSESDTTAQPLANDTDDADTGPNNLQNYPVLSNDVILSKTSMHISGSLNSEASKKYRIEFFANAGCDGSGHGQGKIFLPLAVPLDVTTSPNDVAFGPIALTVPADRHVITATATDPDGNTSEFSDCSQEDTIFSDFFEGD
jgi:CSLREA domain-containing protein